MPYYKVPVNMSITGLRYVEAADEEEAQLRAIENCDNTLPHINGWEEDGEVEAAEDVEEIDFDEYEENQSDI